MGSVRWAVDALGGVGVMRRGGLVAVLLGTSMCAHRSRERTWRRGPGERLLMNG